MAKQMSYTDPDTGAVYTQSYWVAVPTLDKTKTEAIINFKMFATKADRDAGKSPIHTKRFIVSDTNWTSYFQLAALTGDGNDPYKACYDYVDATYDSGIKSGYILEDDGTYTKDVDGSTVSGSEAIATFFDGATDV